MTHYDVTKYEMTKDDLSYTALDGMREMLQNGCHIQLQNKVSLARIIKKFADVGSIAMAHECPV